MLPSMDKLPLDVWDEIFRYACTDGGQTGAALARTSSGFRAASAAYRFHSLKFSSLAEVGRFMLCLDRIERAQAPHAGVLDQRSVNTRHLLLSFFPDDCASLVRPWRGWSQYSTRKSKRQAQVAEDERAWLAAKGAWDRQFVYLVPRLFRMVAPTLETLSILQHPGIALPQVSVEFFALRELSLLASDAIFVRPSPLWLSLSAPHGFTYTDRLPAPFPSLTHLHIVYEGSKQHSWEKTLPMWAELAPAMTHLRVSQASNLIPEVLEAMSMPPRSYPRARATPEFRLALSHPRLRKIIIQPLVLQPVKGHDFRREAETVAQAPRGRGWSRIVVLRGRWHRDGYWRDRLRWEWEDRMLGKAGCWGEDEKDEGEWAHERRKRAEVTADKASRTQATKGSGGQLRDLIRLDNPDRIFRSFGKGFLRQGGKSLHGRAASL
ncbi:hypothetical protein C8Q77DRAFT_1116050 [Trametes polyzona]|nr:hypothetical protein C8Q77DRAFT_1116050 [Trametes polyzona]